MFLSISFGDNNLIMYNICSENNNYDQAAYPLKCTVYHEATEGVKSIRTTKKPSCFKARGIEGLSSEIKSNLAQIQKDFQTHLQRYVNCYAAPQSISHFIIYHLGVLPTFFSLADPKANVKN